MSIEAYVKHGHHCGLLGVKNAYPIYPVGEIQLFDIGEDLFIGAHYPDGARQAQPIQWQSKEVIHALKDLNSRPSNTEHPSNTRPKLKLHPVPLPKLRKR